MIRPENPAIAELNRITAQMAEQLGLNRPAKRPEPTPKLSPFEFSEYADEAAKRVEYRIVKDERRSPMDRMPVEVEYLEPVEDTITIDVTDAIRDDVVEWGFGSYVEEHDQGEVQKTVRNPVMSIVDKDGNPVPGARVVIELQTIELD